MKKIFTSLLCSLIMLVLMFPSSGKAQNPYMQNNRGSFTDKLYFGGQLGFTIGTYTSISIWPLVGYKATPKLSFGLQPGYEYISYDYFGLDYSASNYGIRAFSRYRFIPQLYGHAEFAYINYELATDIVNNEIITEREFVPFLFLGGGFSQPIAGNAYMYAQVLFDVLQDKNSPYQAGEPFWSIGVVAGF